MKKILCIFFCLLPILGGKAQTLYKDQVRIEKESIKITISSDNGIFDGTIELRSERKPETGIQQCSHIDSIS